MNKKIENSLDYHEKTKHSQVSVMNSRHYLDWNNRPNPFKIYVNLTSRTLPTNFPIPSMNAIRAIKGNAKDQEEYTVLAPKDYGGKSNNDSKFIGLTDISSILFFTCGITRHVQFDSGSYYMRAASATGALYPIEVYLVSNSLPNEDLDAGIYHFNPGEFSLVPIRLGDYRNFLSSLAGNSMDILTSPISLVFTSNAWRNSWKYQSRSYRHWFWDTGVIVANLLAVGYSMGLDIRLTLGFVDEQVNNLLGLETHKEASVLIASIDNTHYAVKKIDKFVQHGFSSLDQTIVEPLYHKIYPLSIKQNFYPEIWKAYDSSKLFDRKEVASWSKVHAINRIKKNQEKKDNKKIRDLKKYYLDQDVLDNNLSGIGKVILKRGSARRFSDVTIPLDIFSTILLNSSGAGGNIPMDYKPDNSSLIEYYVLVNSVEGLESGGYYLDKDAKCLEFLRERPTEDFSGHLCLDQSLFENASVIIFLMADLKFVLESLGNRGYRAAQLESGIIAGRIYLLSYACGIGASGSTFYDDEVNAFFCPNDKQMETMIAVGVGVPSYKSKSGNILPVRLSREQMMAKNSSIF